MLIIHTITLLSIASITLLLPRSVLSNCCYSFTCQSSANRGGLPSFQISVTASSQNAINSPGSVYQAQIKFPSDYVLSTIPSNCVATSINAASCSSSGVSQLVEDFAGVIIATDFGKTISPQVQSVVVNGEQCGFQNVCPVLTPDAATTLSWNPTKTTIAASTATTATTATPTTPTTLTITTITITMPTTSATSSVPTFTTTTTTTTAASNCPPTTSRTPSPSVNLPATDKHTPESNHTGLIVGLILGIVVFVFLSGLCILRRNKNKGRLQLPLFLRIDRKGSGISLGRGGSPVGTGLRGDNDANLEGRNRFGADKRMESEAPSEIPSTQTAQVVVRELMDGQADGRSEARSKRADESNNRGQGMTTTRSSPYEGPRQGRGNEGNYLEKRNNEVEREDELGNPNDTAIPAVAIEYQPLHRGGAANRSGLAKSKNYSWVAPATGKNAILQRAVSAASSRFIRTYSSRPLSSSNLYQDPYHRPGAPMFPRTGVISFRKNPILPPKSVNRVSSRGQPNPSGNVITTIKPEHQQQQMRQLQIENDSAYNSQGRSDGDYRPMLRNYRQLVNSGYDIQGSGIRTSDTEVFTNPGPPPQPPQLAATPSTRLAQPSSRGYAYPIHIRPQTRVSGIQQTLGSGNNAQTLYGYM